MSFETVTIGDGINLTKKENEMILTNEIIDSLNSISRLGEANESMLSTDIQTIELAVERLRELQAEEDSHCPRPSKEGFRIGDHTSAGCIKRGECGCCIGGATKAAT